MRDVNSGTLYGIGTGPGDPGLLTQKAKACIMAADLICLPQAERETCRAYQTALRAVPELAGKPCLCFPFPMTRRGEEVKRVHEEVWGAIRRQLLDGKSCAFLTIGDPAVYSTFTYIAKLAAAENFQVKTVSGVASYQAAAASLGISLCEGDEELHIGTGAGDVEALLSLPGTKVIMKCGAAMPRIMELLRKAAERRHLQVYAVTDCGLESERRYCGMDEIPEAPGYMTTVIVKEERGGTAL